MEFIGTVQFFTAEGKRTNPTSLYLERLEDGECRISWRLPQWQHITGVGATPGKAAWDFEVKLKEAFPQPAAYDGPAWNGIKAEKPTPPKVAAVPKPTPTGTTAPPSGPTPAVPTSTPPPSAEAGGESTPA